MVPTPLFYQLLVVALVLLCLLIHVGLPDMPLPKPQQGAGTRPPDPHFEKRLAYCTFEQYSSCQRHAACACDHLPPHWEGAESDDTRQLRALDGRTLCPTAWQRMHRAQGRCHLCPLGAGGGPRSWSLLQQGGHCKHPSSPKRGCQASRQRRDGTNLTPRFTIMVKTPPGGAGIRGRVIPAGIALPPRMSSRGEQSV